MTVPNPKIFCARFFLKKLYKDFDRNTDTKNISEYVRYLITTTPRTLLYDFTTGNVK